VKATEVTAGLAESNGSLLPGIWPDSLHDTCGLTACIPGSAPGPKLGNEYGKFYPFLPSPLFCLPPLRVPLSFLLPSFPLEIELLPRLRIGSLGSAEFLPSRSGRNPAAKRIWAVENVCSQQHLWFFYVIVSHVVSSVI